MRSIDRTFVAAALPQRAAASHKGSHGRLHILAGSARYRGAAVLAAGGALRAGAGLVQLYATEAVCAAVAAQLPTCMLLPVKETAAGGVVPNITAGLLAEGDPTALLAGPGMGNTHDTAMLCRTVLGMELPLVLDADMLNVLAGHLQQGEDAGLRKCMLAALSVRKAPTILTPHPGEMGRLTGLSAEDVLAGAENAAACFAAETGTIVVLKSHTTLVALPDGTLYNNESTGNAGLAKGGSGDVLAGIIAALLAQGLAPATAASCGVWLHARAADILAGTCGLYALSPADLPLALGAVFKELGR